MGERWDLSPRTYYLKREREQEGFSALIEKPLKEIENS